MVSVDITCDFMDEDETGLVWTFCARRVILRSSSLAP